MIMIATTASMIGQFNLNNIRLLINMGYEVSVACNFNSGSSWNQEDSLLLQEQLHKLGVILYNIPLKRSPLAVFNNLRSLYQLNEIFKQHNFDFTHCHTPMGGVIARLVAKHNHVPSVYTAHGFHFFKKGPLKNWLLYYPVEKWLSKLTKVLLTINSQDFSLANQRFHADKVFKIPGIGINLKKFNKNMDIRVRMRSFLGVSDQQIMILSVGELNKNKNHQVIIEALNILNDARIKYFIVGIGNQIDNLQNLVTRYNLEDSVKFLGYRTDVADLDKATDIFAFPSYREGLGLSAIEAMASGAVLVTSNSGGILDYSINGKTGYNYNPNDAAGFANGIKKIAYDKVFRNEVSDRNIRLASKYSEEYVQSIMKEVYDRF